MESKGAFMFLVVCIIAMIDLGSCLNCYKDCFDTETGCKDGKLNKTCKGDENWCCHAFSGSGRNCLWDADLPACYKQSDCKPCQQPLCNG